MTAGTPPSFTGPERGLSALEALTMARAAGVSLALNGETVRIRYPLPRPQAVIDALRAHKAEIVRALTNNSHEPAASVPDAWSTGLAGMRARAPAAVPAALWASLVEGSHGLLANGWAAKAHMLGWTALDLFGCHPLRPCARVDCQGLVWALARDRTLAALSRDQARLLTPSGATLRFHRRAAAQDAGAVPLWELARLRIVPAKRG